MINPWTQGRVPGVRIFPTLGAWQNRRKLWSAGWVPPQWVRLSLLGAHKFWYQFPQLAIAAGATELTRLTVTEDFWLLTIMSRASSNVGSGASGSFRFQIYEDEGTYKYWKYAANQNNGSATAREPGLERIPHFIRAGSPINARIQNLDPAATNTVNLCMFGYSKWWRS